MSAETGYIPTRYSGYKRSASHYKPLEVRDPGEWMDGAKCSGGDPGTWFNPATAEVAMRVCRSCPVRRECAQYALDVKATDGVWAGVDLSQTGVRVAAKRLQLAERAAR